MTTGTERCPQCDDNNRCGHEWHGDTWEHQAATVIRGLRTELDAARAREVELTDAIDSLLALITGETGENCDVQRAIEALSETRAQFEARILKREAKLREALKAVVNGNDIAAERNHSIESWPGSPIRRQACAALAEGAQK